MKLHVKRHGAEEFTRVLLRAWECDPREKIRFRVEIAGDQGLLILNPKIRQVRRRKRSQPDQASRKADSFIYDLPAEDAGDPEAMLADLTSFTVSQTARIRMISRPSNVEIALLNQAELQVLAKFAAGKDWRALLPFILPPQSEWRINVLPNSGQGRFAKCHVWLSAAEVKRLLLERPDIAGTLLAVRCPGVQAELPQEENPSTVASVPTSELPTNSLLENCPRCNGQTEMNGDGRLICHFCGQIFHPSTPKMPVAA
jgi:hypothetical protein